MAVPAQIHPFEQMTTPGGVQVPVDEDLVPLLERLWALGMRTKSSCQDYGALLAMSAPGLPAGDQRWVDFHADRCWVEMDAADAEELVGLLSRDGELRMAVSQWGTARSWLCVRPLLPALEKTSGHTASSAHLFFPREHLDRVLHVLSAVS
ncbi:hypothetical protein [Nocardiopsis sp. LOL_012]|uniref:hypothetical protein n=1 Tax=Nocardiopsis sp. LOL_012 TaxID=3345409 RepID=UPI003A8AF155